MNRFHLGLLVFTFSAGSAIWAQDAKLPRLPGAVETAPEWLKDAPFDVKAFFQAPPADQNAAPLYLEALYEFGEEMAVGIPSATSQRTARIKDRKRELENMYASWHQDSTKVSAVDIDRLVAEFAPAMTKLAKAQQRPKCVFETGISTGTPIPHAMAARSVARMAVLQVARDLAKGQIDTAIGRIEPVLRLSRDLRPRGVAVTQIVSVAMDAMVVSAMIDPILEHPKLAPTQCTQLLAMLQNHESQGLDRFTSGVEGEYIIFRSLIRGMEDGILAEVNKSGQTVDTKLDDAGQLKLMLTLISAKESVDAMSNPLVTIMKAKAGYANINDPAYIQKIKAKLEATKPDHSESRKVHDEIVRSLLASVGTPYPKMNRDHQAFTKSKLKGGLYDPPMVLRLMMPGYDGLLKVATRGTSLLAAAKVKVAIRRWQLTHKEKLTDLDAIMLDAGFPPTPTDPYSGKPIKLAEINGKLIVYTIGEDGVDDGGKLDNDMGRKPLGDHTYPVPQPKEPAAK